MSIADGEFQSNAGVGAVNALGEVMLFITAHKLGRVAAPPTHLTFDGVGISVWVGKKLLNFSVYGPLVTNTLTDRKFAFVSEVDVSTDDIIRSTRVSLQV